MRAAAQSARFAGKTMLTPTTTSGHTMNTKLATGLFVIAASLLPIAGYSADADTPSTKTFAKDSVITTKVKTELAAAKLSSLVHIKVKTNDAGVVTLRGTVKTQEAADKAVSIAQAVSGVTSVENNIKIVAGK
jgi:hyperosmotically inducible periplasmic protein